LLGKFNVPLEGLHTETGPGVYEAAIFYNDILETADRATLFKAAVKEIGHRHVIPTFMAKSMDVFTTMVKAAVRLNVSMCIKMCMTHLSINL
jgi:glutamine synthetase